MSSEDPPDPEEAIAAQVKKFKNEDRKDFAHIVLNVGKEHAKIITSLLLTDSTTKEVWKNLTDSYQKENIQSKLYLPPVFIMSLTKTAANFRDI